MPFSRNKKKNGVGQERRGRKPKGWDKRLENIISEAVETVQEDARMAKRNYEVGNHVVLLDSSIDHKALVGGKYTPADKVAAATAYLVTGKASKAELYCGVPAQTISKWKREADWWPQVTSQIRKDKGDEMDAHMTGILHRGLEHIDNILENGQEIVDRSGNRHRQEAGIRDITYMMDRLFSQRQLLRGDPTSRVEKISTQERLSKLKQEFEKFSQAKTIDVIPEED